MNLKLGRKTGSGLIFVLMAFLIAVYAFGDGTSSQNAGRRHQGPPPEAFAACEGKSEGDQAEFVSPHGDTVSGTCEKQGDRLVLHPDNPPDGRKRNDARD